MQQIPDLMYTRLVAGEVSNIGGSIWYRPILIDDRSSDQSSELCTKVIRIVFFPQFYYRPIVTKRSGIKTWPVKGFSSNAAGLKE